MATQKEQALEAIKRLALDEGTIRELSTILDRAQNSETCVDGSLDERTWNLIKRVEVAAQHLADELYNVAHAMRHDR